MNGSAPGLGTAAQGDERRAARAVLMFERTQVLAHLQHACQPPRRATLLDELALLDARIAELTDTAPLSSDSGA